jgi:sec-independent protein translocase protein TatB
MFEVGYSEIFITAIVALLVLGPERLPKAARFAGLWLRRARAQWYSVRAELERELASEELRRGLKSPLAEIQPQMREMETELRAALAEKDFRVPELMAEPAAAPPETKIDAPPGPPAES